MKVKAFKKKPIAIQNKDYKINKVISSYFTTYFSIKIQKEGMA